MTVKNIALITNIIHPCRIPVLNYFREFNPGLKVFYMSRIHSNRDWDTCEGRIKYKFEILKGLNYFCRKLDLSMHINFGLLPLLVKGNFDVVVSEGYELPGYCFVLAYTKLFKKKLVLWSGSTLLSRRIKNPIVDVLKKAFIKNADAYLAYGSLSKEYLQYFGAEEEKIVVSCNTVDILSFSQRSFEIGMRKDEIKMQKRFPKHVILFSGQLIERKGLGVLLEAFSKIYNKDMGLVIVGDGPERSKNEDFVNRNNIKNVYFEGSQKAEKLYEYYAIADVFVLPSLIEVWGLVLNEAMACGLPVLCSSMVGAAKDLVKDGINGYVFNPHDSDELADKLNLLFREKGLRKTMGEKSRQLISDFTPQKYAKDLNRAVEIAAGVCL